MDSLLVGGYSESADLPNSNPQSNPIFMKNQQLVQPYSYPPNDPNQRIDSGPFSSILSNGDNSVQEPDFPDDCLNFISEILMEEDLDDKFSRFHDYSESADLSNSNPQSNPIFMKNQQFVQPYSYPPNDPNQRIDSAPFSSILSNGDNSVQEPDFPDDCLNFISEILMEEDLDDKFSRIHDHSLIQATEQSFLDALREDSLDPLDQIPSFPGQVISLFSPLDNDGQFDWFTEAIKHAPENCTSNFETGQNQIPKEKHEKLAGEILRRENLIDGSKARKTHQRDESDYQDNTRSSKLLAAYDDDYVEMEQYDDVMLWEEGKYDCSNKKPTKNGTNAKASSKGRRQIRTKKQSQKEEIVDLRALLTLCAQAVSSFDMRNANDLLKQIKQHSSQYGDSIERVAHYFACGLEARLAGTGSHLSVDRVAEKYIPSSDILKTYRTYVQAVPLRRTSYYLVNQTIGKMCENATTIHIIDFGIFLGFQWPCFIQFLARRPNGPPKLRITGIGLPQSGFKPAAIVEETGKRLEGYCKRFGVPFEYHFIAKRWDAISPEEIRVKRDDFVAVNCLYESRSLFDEPTEEDSPKDAFLRLIRSLNPDIFVHGVINGTFNAPFFLTRFKEALFHYSTIFDMLEATIPKEDPERLTMERELHGKAAVNVIACEGFERLERPETYKQWQVRTLRGGFRPIALDQELVRVVKAKVKANYHKDFMLGEDGHWMLQGWKGRILYAISCWRLA